jgi:lipoate-protein ligase A
MNYYFLDKVSWEHSQMLYHAAAYLQHEALFILRPATPYVCTGFHQDVEQEIDLEYIEQNKIPVFRREVGGGAVFLDGEQLFFQLIIRNDRQEVPVNKGEFYKEFLQPVVDTYREFGMPAEYKPVNDIIANGRKVSGTGAAEINDMVILVGNFILDFDYETMSKCLKVPDEKFRDKVFKTLFENLSTFQREIGSKPDSKQLGDSLAKKYETILGKMEWKLEVSPELVKEADRLFEERISKEWTYGNDHRKTENRDIKIRDGVQVVQRMFKSPGGLIRVSYINENDIIKEVHISGDFFFFPANDLPRLETKLDGVPYNHELVLQAIKKFYDENSVDSPGVQPEDLTEALIPG